VQDCDGMDPKGLSSINSPSMCHAVGLAGMNILLIDCHGLASDGMSFLLDVLTGNMRLGPPS
jgi:hypothetical protein